MSRITRAAWQWKFPAHVLVIIVLTASLFHHPASGLSTTNTYLVLVGHSNLPSTRRGASPLLMTKKKEDDDMNVLSDLDARVLQSMLREKNVLDLQQEVNMKKLLERAVRPKSTTTTTTDLPKSNKDNGPYSSELFKTLSDTKLWKSLQAKADEVLESAKLFVTNRIERDVTLLANVGLFAWDRAVRDVARALPATATTIRTTTATSTSTTRQFLLGNSSSYFSTPSSTMEELNTPLDEIKSVTQAIRDILFNGDTVTTTTTNRRSLRTVAPAGQANSQERQRRAYARRKETTFKQEGTINMNLGTISDTAWEIKRELEVETSRPGYRTESIRNAIEAGTQTTVRVIGAVKEGKTLRQALFGEKEKPALESNVVVVETARVPTVEMEIDNEMRLEAMNAPMDRPIPESLLEEQLNVMLRLRKCIEQPEETWLTANVLESINMQINDERLLETVTAMINARDELLDVMDEEVSTIQTIQQLVSQLKNVKSRIDSIISLAAVSAGDVAASRLKDFLYGTNTNSSNDTAVLLSIDDIQAQYEASEMNDIMETEARTNAKRLEIAGVRPRQVQVEEDEIVLNEIDRSEMDSRTTQFASKAAGEALNRKVWFADSIESEEDWSSDTIFESDEKVARTAELVMGYDDDFTTYVPEVIATNYMDVMVSNVDRSNVPNVAKIYDDDFSFVSTATEIVSDLEYDSLKSAVIVGQDEEEGEVFKEDENIVIQLSLRSLDVVVLIVEKIIISGIPNLLSLGMTVSTRLDETSRGGLGRIGWKRLVNSKSGSKRY